MAELNLAPNNIYLLAASHNIHRFAWDLYAGGLLVLISFHLGSVVKFGTVLYLSGYNEEKTFYNEEKTFYNEEKTFYNEEKTLG